MSFLPNRANAKIFRSFGAVTRKAGGGASDVVAPIISGESYNTTTDTLTLTVSEPVTLYALHNASATPLTAAAIQAGAEVTEVLPAGEAFIDWDDSAWGAGTWYLHIAVRDAGGNTDTATPFSHVIAAPYVANAVRFNGTNTWLSQTGMTTPTASMQGTFGMCFRVPANWPAGSDYIVNFRKAGTTSRFSIRGNRNSDGITLNSGRLSISVRNDADSADGYFVLGDFAVPTDQWVSLALTYDSTQAVTADRWKCYTANGSGAWSVPSTAFAPALPLNMIAGATASCVVGAEELTGVYFFPAWDLSYLYYAPGTLVDLTDSAVREKFRATNAGRLADGSGISGAAPFIYLDDVTATFQVNKGSGGGFTENGTLTTSPGPLP